MDLLYFFTHSRHGDEELRYSLRSVAKFVPECTKVWILGDRPAWLSDDTSVIEVVSQESVLPGMGWTGRQTNFFRMMVLGAQIPGLAEEYLKFCDDYILLDTLTGEDAASEWCHRDLTGVTTRGTRPWQVQLWRTLDELARRGLPQVNFEPHRPQRLTKTRVMAAYDEFRSLCAEPMREGLLGLTATLNLALAREGFTPRRLADGGRQVAFHHTPPTLEAVRTACAGQACLNFDDAAYGPAIRQFLAERFPEPSLFERPDAAPIPPVAASSDAVSSDAVSPTATPMISRPLAVRPVPVASPVTLTSTPSRFSMSPRDAQPTGPSPAPAVTLPPVGTLAYANVCRVTGSPEEMLLDFALLSDPTKPSGEAATRIVLTPRTAKRVAAALAAAVGHHEKLFGPIETDLDSRLRVRPAPPRPPAPRPSVPTTTPVMNTN